jgi:tRNA A-37 threonylcarbamoyl transferase component Bud32
MGSQSQAELSSALAPGGRVLRYRRHRWAFSLEPSQQQPGLAVKVYRPKNAVDWLLENAMGGRGPRSQTMATRLLDAGLPTPRVVGSCRLGQSFVLATEMVPGHELLTQHLKRRFVQANETGKLALLRRVAILVGQMHQAGFVHGDLTASNIILGPGQTEESRPLFLIDLDRTKDVSRWPRPVAEAYRMADLRLLFLTSWGEVSPWEWRRMLVWYCRGWIQSPAARRRVVRRVTGARRGRGRLGASAPTVGGRIPYGQRP